MLLKFVPSESAFAYFQGTREYLETHRKPIALYSDKHLVWRPDQLGVDDIDVPEPDLRSIDGETQLLFAGIQRVQRLVPDDDERRRARNQLDDLKVGRRRSSLS